MRADDIAAVHANEILAYPQPWTQDIFHDCLTHDYRCRVAEVGNMIAGHGIMSAPFGQAHILNICIAPQWQGRGFGRRLIEHLLGVAQKHDALVAFLQVRPSNVKAIHLYQSIGFSKVGRRRNYYPLENSREDAIVMTLSLDSHVVGSGTAHQPSC